VATPVLPVVVAVLLREDGNNIADVFVLSAAIEPESSTTIRQIKTINFILFINFTPM